MSDWKHPNEVIRLHRLKQKQKALQLRLLRKNPENVDELPKENLAAQKRKNPFLKYDGLTKKIKSSSEDFSSEDSIFKLLANNQIVEPVLKTISIENTVFKVNEFNYINNEVKEEILQKHFPNLPIDWSLKTRLRILSETLIPGNNLKTSQEASGLTSFVRCIDPESASTSLDISPGAQFHQSTLYWQHPNLPWLTLFPRSSKANNGVSLLGEKECTALSKDWSDSFRALFQLVRARQCPYFYVCANSFTVLFRAAGICGRAEIHALLTPTSRGMRASLKQEDIEFIMPLKRQTSELQNKSNDLSLPDNQENENFSVLSESQSLMSEEKSDDDDDDDLDDDKWLESLGVAEEEIKKIQLNHARKKQSEECGEDFTNLSIILIEGAECQAFFNFLLNAKSTTAKVGRLSGIPPTLLSPVAFQGATLKTLSVRSSKVRMDSKDYFSMELKGVILPHVLPYICNLLTITKDSFSATMASHPTTIAFSRASEKLNEDVNKENKQSADLVFGRENLSDCGISLATIDIMCSVNPNSVSILERICYQKSLGGYNWS